MRIAPLAFALLVGCSGGATRRPAPPRDPAAAAPALAELRAARFAETIPAAGAVLAAHPGHPEAAAARALARYVEAMHELVTTTGAVLESADDRFDHAAMRAGLERAYAELAAVDADLALAEVDPAFALELCLACWERDWNRTGEIDERDRLLFQIELDARGEEIPEGDPRRTPTFRFDVGDVHWARAMVAFQRAALDLILAYQWSELDRLLASLFSRSLPVITIRLGDRGRVAQARAHLLAGLGHSDRARRAYLAETDDQREWVPSPSQHDHPLPLPVDAALYATWEGVLGDLRRLIERREGLDAGEIAQLGDHQWERPPRGFIDVGRMLAEPRDLVFDLGELGRLADDEAAGPEPLLRSLFGVYYVERMQPSPLPARLARMKAEVERGDDSLERKLRYLLWLN